MLDNTSDESANLLACYAMTDEFLNFCLYTIFIQSKNVGSQMRSWAGTSTYYAERCDMVSINDVVQAHCLCR